MKKILIVEDDSTQQQAYKLKLSQKYQLDFAVTGVGIQKTVESLGSDLIILDIMLPGGKNGYDVLQELKESPNTNKIPVIMLTNLGEEERATALACGATEYHTKTSIGPEEIVAIVDKYL